MSGPDVVATYNQEQKVEQTTLEFASKNYSVLEDLHQTDWMFCIDSYQWKC